MSNRIVTCGEWGARPPRHEIVFADNAPDKIIEHGTDGHATGTSEKQAYAYARMIQEFHMGPERGWNDSGHNFLVMRNGLIFEGRHRTVEALLKGRMVVSAHCPGQNGNPGIEHEHKGEEALTDVQKAASVWLHKWIMAHAPTIGPHDLHPHRQYYSTDCPTDSIVAWIPELTAILTQPDDENILGGPSFSVGKARRWAKDRKATDEFVTLANTYWKLAEGHGMVRPEVAFAQAAHETGFGHFGGTDPVYSVDKTYHNPCGMKTHDGSHSQRFPDWNSGCSAHLDHLALYAGARGYPRQDTQDPRHFNQLRGTAATVLTLGGKWAPSSDYGARVVRFIRQIEKTA